MDRSLWLLLRLQIIGWLRFWSRSVRSLKGLVLTVVAVMLAFPVVFASFFAPRVRTDEQAVFIRLYGPLALLGFCLAKALFSNGARSLYFSPSEVNFLFPGPFRPRQLLLYRIVVGAGAGLLVLVVMVVATQQHAPNSLSALVGIFFTYQFLFLFSLAMALLFRAVGGWAFGWARRLVLVAALAVAAIALRPLYYDAVAKPLGEILETARNSPRPWSLAQDVLAVVKARLDSAIRSPWVSPLLVPFRPFVEAFTARRVWPDLVGWGAVSAGVDLALLGLVLGLNANFLESSASSSERIYLKIRRAKRGQGWDFVPQTLRVGLPMLPWWGGVGPNLWRHLTTVSRSVTKLTSLVVIFAGPVLICWALSFQPELKPIAVPTVGLVLLGIAFFAPGMVGFDFQTDFERLEELKTLPIAAKRLALGEVLTPVLILTAYEWAVLAAIYPFARGLSPGSGVRLLIAVAALTPPTNLLLVGVENLFFLAFPTRVDRAKSFDVLAKGRHMLLFVAKTAGVGVTAGLAACAGAAAHYLAGPSWTLTVGAIWLVVAACGLAVLPLLAQAFERFDVSETVPG